MRDSEDSRLVQLALTTGTVGAGLLAHVAYLAVMSAMSLPVATRRLDRRLRV